MLEKTNNRINVKIHKKKNRNFTYFPNILSSNLNIGPIILPINVLLGGSFLKKHSSKVRAHVSLFVIQCNMTIGIILA